MKTFYQIIIQKVLDESLHPIYFVQCCRYILRLIFNTKKNSFQHLAEIEELDVSVSILEKIVKQFSRSKKIYPRVSACSILFIWVQKF